MGLLHQAMPISNAIFNFFNQQIIAAIQAQNVASPADITTAQQLLASPGITVICNQVCVRNLCVCVCVCVCARACVCVMTTLSVGRLRVAAWHVGAGVHDRHCAGVHRQHGCTAWHDRYAWRHVWQWWYNCSRCDVGVEHAYAHAVWLDDDGRSSLRGRVRRVWWAQSGLRCLLHEQFLQLQRSDRRFLAH
jgi:hypothetical protein